MNYFDLNTKHMIDHPELKIKQIRDLKNIQLDNWDFQFVRTQKLK